MVTASSLNQVVSTSASARVLLRVAAAAPPRRSRYLRWKRTADNILAALLLIPGLPLIGLLVVLVRLTSRGPGIYKQVRVGRGGRLFTMYKIRSMTVNAEARSGAVWARLDDPRVTLVGGILRRFHLDELPQLFNVLKGEMALVGPRPERPEFVESLSRIIPAYPERLAVLPGITGLAQVNLPPDTDLDSVRRKLYLDRLYIRSLSFWLDLRLLSVTIAHMIKIPEWLLVVVFAVYRTVPDSVCAPTRSRQVVTEVPLDTSAADEALAAAADGSPEG